MNAEDRGLLAQARAALAASRWAEAAEGFRAALETGSNPDALFGLGVASFWLGDTHAALRRWQEAYVAYRRKPDPSQAAMSAVYLSLSYRMSMGNSAAARGWLGRAARLVADEQLDELRGWVLLCRADLANDTGHPAAAEGWAREAIELARGSGDLDLELCALSELGAALVEQGRTEEGIAASDEAMAGALAGEGRLDLDSVVLVSCRTITTCSRGGDLTRATQWVRAAGDFNERHGSPHLYTTCRTQYGSILYASGRWDDAETEMAAALRIGEVAEPTLHATALATLAEIRVAQGRLEEAARLLAGFEDHPVAAVASATVRMARGQPAPAAASLRRRLRDLDAGSLEAAAVQELLVAAESEMGLAARASKHAADLAAWPAAILSDVVRARGKRAMGRAALKDQPTLAAEHLDRAITAFVDAGMPVEVARTRLLRARALSTTEPTTAVAELEQALETFEQVGARWEADAAAALLRQMGSRPARGSRAIGLLTKRELDVLALLGEGLSNREIGKRLFITRKTVEHHVANVLAKVGLSGRAEAAAYAIRQLNRGSARK